MAGTEIRVGDFLYHDALFVDLGPGKRHTRAGESELRALLLPKKGSAAVKDEVAHYYEAQLLHYGLARSKDKSVAKLRLITALNGGALTQPPALKQMEAEMKKKYVAAARKGEMGAKEAKGKRKRDVEEEDVTVNIQVSGGQVNVDVRKKIKTKSESVAAAPARAKKAEPKSSAAATTASKSSSSKSTAPVSKTASTPKPSKPSAMTEKASSRKSEASTSKLPASQAPKPRKPPAKPRASVPKGQKSSSLGVHEPRDCDDSSPYGSPPPAYESHSFDSPSQPTQANASAICGTYVVDVWSDSFHYSNCTLSVGAVSYRQGQGCLWGILCSSEFDVLIKLWGGHNMDFEERAFSWRAVNTETGELEFRKSCTGHIDFNIDGGMQGRLVGGEMFGGEDVLFGGMWQDRDQPDCSVLRDRWEGMADTAYGRH